MNTKRQTLIQKGNINMHTQSYTHTHTVKDCQVVASEQTTPSPATHAAEVNYIQMRKVCVFICVCVCTVEAVTAESTEHEYLISTQHVCEVLDRG